MKAILKSVRSLQSPLTKQVATLSQFQGNVFQLLHLTSGLNIESHSGLCNPKFISLSIQSAVICFTAENLEISGFLMGGKNYFEKIELTFALLPPPKKQELRQNKDTCLYKGTPVTVIDESGWGTQYLIKFQDDRKSWVHSSDLTNI